MTEELPFWLHKHVASFDKEKMHHAFLISGRQGIGKSRLISHLSLITLCSNANSVICGECNSCKFSNLENHPDFHELQVLENKKLVGISQIHELRHKLYESSFLGKNKVASLTNIEKISMDGLNALLKILEEPPENTFFFLSTSFLNQIPATIQSRCIDIDIITPKTDETLDWLSSYERSDAIKALQLNDNLPFSAEEFLEKGMLEIRTNFVQDISGIIKEGKDLISVSDKWIKDESSLNIKLEWMSLILSDAVKFNADNSINQLNEDTDNITRYLSSRCNMEKIHMLLSKTNSLWNLFCRESNLRKDYQLNSLFVDWEKELGISKKI
tara:strand:- start:1639 stop:2622 length:984 start_codon:yes stop_codon:yes gene_type:complete